MQNFSITGKFLSQRRNGNGNVNDTIVVEIANNDRVKKYTLQRINHNVFKDPIGLMDNYSRVTRHLQTKENSTSLSLISSLDGDTFYKDENGDFWRMMPFIEGVHCYEVAQKPSHAYEAAKTFGNFQVCLSDLPGKPLNLTIPDFHDTNKCFLEYEKAKRLNIGNRIKEVVDLDTFIKERRYLCNAIKTKDLPVRIVHNDTKLNNVLLDEKTGEGVSVIDLDTVMPGCVLHDFGDLVRTTCNSSDENEKDLSKVNFKPDYFESITSGYLDATQDMLCQDEVDGLAISPHVITYELGIRFLSDFLNGDKYFKIIHHNQNFERAQVQFKLLESMEKSKLLMEEVVAKNWAMRKRTIFKACPT